MGLEPFLGLQLAMFAAARIGALVFGSCQQKALMGVWRDRRLFFRLTGQSHPCGVFETRRRPSADATAPSSGDLVPAESPTEGLSGTTAVLVGTSIGRHGLHASNPHVGMMLPFTLASVPWR